MKRICPILIALLLFAGCSPSPAPQQSGHTVRVAVSCADLIDNIELIDSDKLELVPDNGMLLAETEIAFSEGETAFELLSRALQDAGIQFEFNDYSGSKYFEGVGNIYEKDCGDASGWLYYVNGESPSVGCSEYAVAEGDLVQLEYICDFNSLWGVQ